MNNILKQAKEIKKGCRKEFINPNINVHDKCGDVLDNEILLCNPCIKQATKLLKIARKGCGEEFDNEELKMFMHCGNSFANTNKQLCPDCQEAIKKLEGISK